jgi:hypothetical protein
MNATLTITGIAEMKDALARLPAELRAKATGHVIEAAYAAQREVVAQYPIGPPHKLRTNANYKGGNLKKGVRVYIKEMSAFAVMAQVRSTAPHAWLWEHGRSRWGPIANPPQPVFIPTMIRHRRKLYQQIAEICRDAGLTVTLEV